MNRQLTINIIIILLVIVGLSVWIYSTRDLGTDANTNPVSEVSGNVSINEVIISSDLEIYNSLTDEIIIENSDNSKFVILSLTIENDLDDLLVIREDGLFDDEENQYSSKKYITINDTTYAVHKITSIDENEVFAGINTEIYETVSQNSTVTKKIIFEIPIDREPDLIKFIYGFKANDLAIVKNWNYVYLQVPPDE